MMPIDNAPASPTPNKGSNPFSSNNKSQELDPGLIDKKVVDLNSMNDKQDVDLNSIKDPIDNQVQSEELISKSETLLNFLKASIGTGILSLSCAFKYSGLWTGLVSMIVLSSVCLYTMHILVRGAHKLQKRLNNKNLDYAKVVEESFLVGPSFCKKISWYMGFLVNLALGFSQASCVAVYQLFVAENIQQVVEMSTGFKMSIRYYELILLVVLIPYSLIRTLKVLAVFNAIASILAFLGMFFVLYVCFTDLPPISSRPAFSSFYTYPFFVGIVLFAFEGIGTVLPVRRRMKNPEEMTTKCGVINMALLFSTSLSFCLGFFGYWKFGELTEESITLNMPSNGLFNAVRLMFAASVFLSIGIQLYVLIAILWDHLSKKFPEESFGKKYGEYILRITLILATFVIAALVPHLDLLISLIGCMASGLLIFVYPVFVNILLNYYTRYHDTRDDEVNKTDETPADSEKKSLLSEGKKRKCDMETLAYYANTTLDFTIVIFGLFLSVIGTFATVVQIINTFKRDSQSDL